MDFDALRVFVDVAKRGSFASVARDLGAEPSKISRIIAGLEDDLGFRLLQRTTRQMALTEAGKRYLDRIERLLEDLEAARDEAHTISEAPAGTLRLTASVAFGTQRIIPLIPEFRSIYPNVNLELVLTDTTLDLVAERVDLAIRLAPAVTHDVICVKLMPTRYRVCASPGYLAQTQPPVLPHDIRRHDCALFSLLDFRSRWMFKKADGPVEDVPVSGSLVISNALALYTATLQGLGPALLPDWITEADLISGRLIDLFPDYEVAATSFDTAAWLIYPSRSFLPQKVRATIDFLKARIGR